MNYVPLGLDRNVAYISLNRAMADIENERHRVATLYAGMDEDELRRLADNASTLTDAGREALKLELSRRGLEIALHFSPVLYDSELSNLPSRYACLEEWDKYSRLNTKDSFWMRYGRALALAPFTILIVVLLRYFSNTTSKVPDYFIWASLVWLLAVVLYALSVSTRILFIRCPRCGYRFGLGTFCGSCGLPRSATPPGGTNLPLS